MHLHLSLQHASSETIGNICQEEPPRLGLFRHYHQFNYAITYFLQVDTHLQIQVCIQFKKSYRGLTHRFMAPRNGILYLRNSKFTNHQRQRIRDGIHDNSNSLKCKYRWLLLISRYDKLIGPQGFVFAVVALDAAAYAWTIHLSSENVMLVCCLMIFY